MLHIDFVDASGMHLITAAERLYMSRVANQIAMALANLKLRESLREQSVRDALTGLYNRRFLEESIRRELALAARHDRSLAVFMIDVDDFKRYNDLHGHDSGDAVLSALGQLLLSSLRVGDVAARYGGEEFTVLLHGAELEGAQSWGERLMESVRAMRVSNAQCVLATVTMSLGLAIYPDTAREPEELLKAADNALYEAKSQGRDRLVVAGGAEANVLTHSPATGDSPNDKQIDRPG